MRSRCLTPLFATKGGVGLLFIMMEQDTAITQLKAQSCKYLLKEQPLNEIIYFYVDDQF